MHGMETPQQCALLQTKGMGIVDVTEHSIVQLLQQRLSLAYCVTYPTLQENRLVMFSQLRDEGFTFKEA